ncbi:Pr6Pr family membrane protein [Streptomyces avermitilis]|uniref:Pr6Pr family membrane protein n=1 Tax=Streptomyces avermitilis TaxID=33903 RepID=UPI0033D0E765
MIARIPKDIPDLPAIPGMPVLMPSAVPAAAVVAPTRRPLTTAFRLLVALTATVCVTIDLILGSPLRVLTYFTVQSSVLVALIFTLSAWRAWAARRPLPALLTGGTLLYAVITGLVYHLLLAHEPTPFTMTGQPGPLTGWQALTNQLLHTVVPAAVALDWLLLTSSGRLRLRQASAWLLYPLAYLALTLARGELILPGTPGRYLYPFLDVEQHGYKSVLGNALLLGLAFYALAVLLVTLDHVRPNPLRRRAKNGFRLQPPVG